MSLTDREEATAGAWSRRSEAVGDPLIKPVELDVSQGCGTAVSPDIGGEEWRSRGMDALEELQEDQADGIALRLSRYAPAASGIEGEALG